MSIVFKARVAKSKRLLPVLALISIGLMFAVPVILGIEELVIRRGLLHAVEEPSSEDARKVLVIPTERISTCVVASTVRLGEQNINLGSTSQIDKIEYEPDLREIRIFVSGERATLEETCVQVPKDLLGHRIRVSINEPYGTHFIQDMGNFIFVGVKYRGGEQVIKISGISSIPLAIRS
jgi:hypothetical protein